jgi:hypothetical protein
MGPPMGSSTGRGASPRGPPTARAYGGTCYGGEAARRGGSSGVAPAAALRGDGERREGLHCYVGLVSLTLLQLWQTLPYTDPIAHPKIYGGFL